MKKNKKKKKKNNKGFGAYEFLTVAVVCLVLTAILLVAILKLSNKEKYQVFNFNARVMAMNAINYNFKDEGTIYLYEMLKLDLISPIKNPFNGKNCDLYESKVEFLKEGKKVTLKCGEYLIDRELVGNKSYTLYRVTDWNDDKEYEANDSKTIYNLSKKGKLVLNNYYEKELLVTMLNEKKNKKYDSLKEIEKDYKLELENNGVELVIKTDIEESTITLDITKFKRIISNLISNSMRYLKDNGKITIEISSDDNNYLFHFKDNGIGVDDKIIDKIFELLTMLSVICQLFPCIFRYHFPSLLPKKS